MILSSLRKNARLLSLILAIFFVMPATVWATISATTVMEVRVGGSDTANGGGFDPANASMATDLAATSANTASPVVTSASCNFVTRHNSTYLFVQGGTNWVPGWYLVVSTAGNAATLDAAVGHVILYKGQTKTNAVAGCATVASPTSGIWSVDYSQQNGAGITYTDMVIDATTNTKYTSAGFPIAPDIVGNMMKVTSGTGFTAQYVQVLSVSGTTATCDKSLGTLSSTGGHGGLGGGFATPDAAYNQAPGTAVIMCKYSATPYSVTATTARVPGGTGGSVIGYDTTRHFFNTDANLPIWRMGANSTRGAYLANTNGLVRNIQFDNPSGTFTSCTGVQQDGGPSEIDRCKFLNLATAVNASSTGGVINNSYAESCTTGFSNQANSIRTNCVAKSCGSGFGSSVSANLTYLNCINVAPTSGTQSCFAIGGTSLIQGCIVYNPTNTLVDGIKIGASGHAGGARVVNNIVIGCTGNGYTQGGTQESASQFVNNAAYNNGTNFSSDIDSRNSQNLITLTADPFTSGSTGDFSLNSTSGGGPLLKAAGFPSSFFGISTLSFPDIGAAQHPNPSTSGTGKKAGPGGGRVGFLERHNVIPFPVLSSELVLTRKAG